MMRLSIVVLLMMCIGIPALAEEETALENLLEGAPYVDKGAGKRTLVDEDHLMLMQIALKPGQSLPRHNANANVHIIVLDGDLMIDLDGKDIAVKKGDLVPVAYKTPMHIRNESKANATFVVIKTPNPSQMGK
jgi:quercetin dioxygenase-like cupin family protein